MAPQIYAIIRAMRTILASAAAVFGAFAVLFAQSTVHSEEHGTLTLHYVQKPIGSEHYTVTREGGGVQLTSDIDFTDRGGRVQLESSLKMGSDLRPQTFRAKGKSYRFVNVDSDIRVDGSDAIVRADRTERRVTLPATFFTVDGYAPFSVQMMLVRYWQQHGRPRVLQTVPGMPLNDVFIEQRGRDAVRIGTRTLSLDRYSIDGVVWGRETLWLDGDGGMVAAITRAGGLSFEAVREDLASEIGEFVQRSIRDRLGDLETLTGKVAPTRSGTFALVGATVIDGTNRAPLANAAIVIKDGRIEDIGPRGSIAIPAGIPVADLAGKTVIPGLWDMHTHLTQIEWMPVYLGAGVTTVRDMGNEFEFITGLRAAVSSRRALGPRILAAGLVDGGGPNAFGVVYAATPEEAKAVVAKYHDAGFQQIKIYSLVTPSIVEAICAEAHRVGMTVTGHVPNGMTIDQAVAAGMDQIAHLAIRGEAGTPEVNKTIAYLKERGTVMDPTQSWNELLGHAEGSPVDAFQPGIAKIPPPLNRIFSNAGAAGIDPAAARARLERGLRIVKALHDAGVPIVAGTDEGVPGHSVYREIELYVEAGFTPLEALQAATIVPARAMKLDAELGTIEKGKRADLAILDANPLDSIRNVRTVRWTISDGRMYESAALWKSVRFQP
jgi:imidazolonepropionase-like amidohydrolase